MTSYHLVIRAAQERTQSASAKLASLQLQAPEQISVISEVPFEATLRAAYESGIKAGKDWTVTVDADVLLTQAALSGLLQDAQDMPSHFVEIEGRVFDKITGRYRPAGHRIYRTELLPLALKHIPANGTQIQPEYFTVQQMGQLGHPYRHVARVVGLHDFEQYYADLYRKALVHSRKMSPLISELIQRCAERLHRDADFLVILKGLWDGLTLNDRVTIDRRVFADRAADALRTLGLEEKRVIADEDHFEEGFAEMFAAVTSTSPAPAVSIIDVPPAIIEGDRNWTVKTQERIAKHGLIGGITASLGGLLRRVGQLLDR